MSAKAVRATIALSSDLLADVYRAIQDGKARNRNDLIVAALRHELAAWKREAIDAAFTPMASDPDYQAEAQTITEEFATAAWEALRQAEADS